jgi:hypothetical protein
MIEEVAAAEEQGTITVFQHRSWYGDPKLGRFVLSVDGRKVGVVPVQESVSVRVAPGRYGLRIRQWWYRSPVTSVKIDPGQTCRLEADVDRGAGSFRRVATLVFAPWRALTLTSA